MLYVRTNKLQPKKSAKFLKKAFCQHFSALSALLQEINQFFSTYVKSVTQTKQKKLYFQFLSLLMHTTRCISARMNFQLLYSRHSIGLYR